MTLQNGSVYINVQYLRDSYKVLVRAFVRFLQHAQNCISDGNNGLKFC